MCQSRGDQNETGSRPVPIDLPSFLLLSRPAKKVPHSLPDCSKRIGAEEEEAGDAAADVAHTHTSSTPSLLLCSIGSGRGGRPPVYGSRPPFLFLIQFLPPLRRLNKEEEEEADKPS